MYLSKESLYGNTKARFILINDCKDLSGLKVFKTILNIIKKEHANLHLLCCDGLIKELFDDINIDHDHVGAVDLFSDAFGWNSSDVSECLLSIDVLVERFLKFKGVIFISSLTPLLIHNGVDKVYKAFHRLLKENLDLQLVALMHSDVQDPVENQIMNKIATTSFYVSLTSENILLSIVRYSSGKVSIKAVEYKISDNYEFSVFHIINPEQKHLPVKQPDPTANLTFNLRLKEDEKEARSHLQLPYMKMQTADESSIQNLCDDCYDEEDPDDDLDI